MQSTDFKQRRNNLFDMMDDGIAILPAAHHATRSNDTEYPFRQNSNFKYLTGINEPESILVLSKKNGVQKTFIFIRPNNAFEEMWNGKRLGLEKAQDLIEADHAYDIHTFKEQILKLLPGHKNLYMHFHEGRDTYELVQKLSGELFNKKRRSDELPPSQIKNLGHLIEKLRFIKDQNEILTMKKAMIATDRAHRAAMAFAAPGKSEKQVDALLHYLFRNTYSQGQAYENIVAGGDNANILHYVENNEELHDGDLLLIDAGSQLNLYATDITRTFPVNGKFSPTQKDVYEIVLAAQKAAISHSFPGRTSKELHDSACKVLTQGLVDLKILKGSVEENLEKNTFRKYYPHGTGHWLGLDVHDQNPYLDEDNNTMKFAAGCIFTVEPGLYFPKNDPEVPEIFKGIGIRIEDNILITDKGHENLSAMIPKEVKEVEEACEKDYRTFLDM